MTRKKILIEDVEPLIDQFSGNIAMIARALDVSRGTVWNRVQESATLQTKLKDAREATIDNVESGLYKKALSGDTTCMIFFLKTQGKHRGWVERQEITGVEGGPVTFKVIEDE